MKHAPRSDFAALPKFTMMKRLLQGPGTSFLMEAHNALSAKIVEEAGFAGIWASGLTMSASFGVRDNNELSWTQVLDALEFMSDATSIPILMDGDTGYGNFNNVRRLVRKLCQRGIAGVCIEDKLFPKTNSFLGEGQPLADMDEFCGKIKAAKDSQEHEDFNVVARVEALIAGRGMEEALRRGEAYADAGADAIVIHSKRSDAGEIAEFMRRWDGRAPVILIPTKYYRTPTPKLQAMGASMIIWANHNLRSAIVAMRRTCAVLREQETLLQVEDEVAPLNDLFALAGADELEQAEARYLGAAQPRSSAVILAATRGEAFAELTEDSPKCMLNVRGRSILEHQLAALKRQGIAAPTVVTGYRHEAVAVPGIRKLVNADYASTGEAWSLRVAADAITGPCIIAYGDVVYRPFFLDLLKDRPEDFVLVVDSSPDLGNKSRADDLVRCSPVPASDISSEDEALLTEIGTGLENPDGQWVGLLGCSASGSRKLRDELDRLEGEGGLAAADLPAVMRRLLARGESIRVVFVNGNWMNVNDIGDLADARNAM